MTELQVDYNAGLSTEQERYLAEVYCKGPVFVMNYPSSIKPFYMRQNDDGNTVGCIDLLVPRVVSPSVYLVLGIHVMCV